MNFNNIHNLNKIPLKVKIGCLGMFVILLLISIIFLTGFIQIFSFLLDTWLGAIIIGIIVLYFIAKRLLPLFGSNNKNKKNTNFTDAEYIEIDEEDINKN